MPAPGDQHTSIANPFAEPQQRISEYTAQEIATLQSRLEKQLGPEYISSRAGPSGQKVHYITAEKCIALANEVFGFNGWSSSIQNIQVDFVDENPQTLKISLGLSVIVRVTLRDGTYHEDLGYGHIENCKGKAAAFEKAKKEGTTDALKRALRHFGNVLGNCIYDKTYLAKVTKMKVQPTKFDESCLHRHPDYVVREKEKGEEDGAKEEKWTVMPKPPPQLPIADSFEDFLGELDEADFNISEEGHPDEVALPNSTETDSNQSVVSVRNPTQTGGGSNKPMHPPARQLARSTSAGNNPPRPPQTPVQQAPRPNANNFPGAGPQNRGPQPGPRPPQQLNQNRPAPQPNNANQNQNPQTHMTPPPPIGNPGNEPVGFFSARAVKHLPEESLVNGNLAPKAGQVFNPKLESPSIRRTPGVDHSASKPLSKSGKHVAPIIRPDDDNDSNANGNGKPPALGKFAPANGGGQQPPKPQQQQPTAGAGPGANVGRPVGAPPPHARPGNMVNPQLDQTRRIGAPVSSSPTANRGGYKVPTMLKRPAGEGPGGVAAAGGGGGVNGGARMPLNDVSNQTAGGPGAGADGGGPEVKRQRTS
ncbi:hypothetical protein VTI74DRAFT_6190 [Chaetomium olivicolor]